eukprot:gene16587-29208_t
MKTHSSAGTTRNGTRVAGNKLGPDGGKAFAKALETNKSLKSL